MSDISFAKDNLNYNIRLKGIFDRIDSVSGAVRIIDYKTGKVIPSDLKFNSWEDLKHDTKFDKSFQLLFYSYIYWKSTFADTSQLTPGIISFRNLKQGFLNIGLPDKSEFSEDVLLQFEDILKDILFDMLNPEITFSQTTEDENCKYCTFKSVCNRN